MLHGYQGWLAHGLSEALQGWHTLYGSQNGLSEAQQDFTEVNGLSEAQQAGTRFAEVKTNSLNFGFCGSFRRLPHAFRTRKWTLRN